MTIKRLNDIAAEESRAVFAPIYAMLEMQRQNVRRALLIVFVVAMVIGFVIGALVL